MTDEPVLDPTAIDTLRDQLGEPVLERVLTAYLDELPRYLGELRAGASRGDAELVGRAAHSLKGASRLVGGEAFAGRCSEVERRAASGDLEDISSSVEEIELMASRVADAIRARLPG